MDHRDEIIKTQLEVIDNLLKNNMSRLGDDIWGKPQPKKDEKSSEKEHNEVPKAAGNEENTEVTVVEEPVENIEDLKKELEGYIGLGRIKKEVNNLINMVTVYKLRKEHDLPTVDMSLHMVFTGNPGTGKTMIARLMARIYRSLGILSKGQLVEVDRSGLVAGYVGQTAQKTSKVIESAKGGVLFIDEAYALRSSSEQDFGQESINTILKAMEDNREDLVIIVAGYDKLMEDFIQSNPGLESRFNRYLHFDDYNLDEMVDIFKMQLNKNKYVLTEDAETAVREYIEAANTTSISFGNARGVRNIFEHVLVSQNNRLAAMENVTVDDLMTINADDISAARSEDTKLIEQMEREEELKASTQNLLDELTAIMGNANETANADDDHEADGSEGDKAE